MKSSNHRPCTTQMRGCIAEGNGTSCSLPHYSRICVLLRALPFVLGWLHNRPSFNWRGLGRHSDNALYVPSCSKGRAPLAMSNSIHDRRRRGDALITSFSNAREAAAHPLQIMFRLDPCITSRADVPLVRRRALSDAPSAGNAIPRIASVGDGLANLPNGDSRPSTLAGESNTFANSGMRRGVATCQTAAAFCSNVSLHNRASRGRRLSAAPHFELP